MRGWKQAKKGQANTYTTEKRTKQKQTKVIMSAEELLSGFVTRQHVPMLDQLERSNSMTEK